MKTEGKARELFEKWLPKYVFQNADDLYGMIDQEEFYNMIPSMRYGVCVDFFDSVGIYVKLNKVVGVDRWIFIITDHEGRHLSNYMDHRKTNNRQEGRTESITKATEILNERL